MKKVTQLPKAVNFMLKGMALLIGLCFLSVGSAFAQGNVTCPPNLDFANGDLTNWQYYIGTATTGTTITTMTGVTPSAPIAGRVDITSGTGNDWFYPFPVVAPGGGPYSVRIGDSDINAKADRISYYVHVPVGFNDYSFNYRFACVLEDPNHPLDSQPVFEVAAFDSATGAALPCLPPAYVASSALIPLGFKNVFRPAGYDTLRVLPWTGAALPLIGVG